MVPRRAWGVVALAVLVASCSSSAGPDATTTTVDIREEVVTGLSQPTQFQLLPDGRLLIAQLNGDEEGGTGQVIVVDPATGARLTLLDALRKPTGVTWMNGTIWVMVERGLVSAPWNGRDESAGSLTVALADLPYNGRSQGTLTPLPDGTLVYETSGDNAGGVVKPGSGALWTYDPETRKPRPIARGLKNAYAHAIVAGGKLVVTEVSGDNADPPPDELNIVELDRVQDFGWPDCPPDSSGDWNCTSATKELVTFPNNSTPTGVAVIGETVYVALWVSGEIRAVDFTAPQPDDRLVFAGLSNPQHLVAEPQGTLLVSEHGAGRIVRLRP